MVIAQEGTVESGFTVVTLPAKFADSLASIEPLPKNCAFKKKVSYLLPITLLRYCQ